LCLIRAGPKLEIGNWNLSSRKAFITVFYSAQMRDLKGGLFVRLSGGEELDSTPGYGSSVLKPDGPGRTGLITRESATLY
jgi:hypothetical protein